MLVLCHNHINLEEKVCLRNIGLKVKDCEIVIDV